MSRFVGNQDDLHDPEVRRHIWNCEIKILHACNKMVLDSTILNYSTRKNLIDYSVKIGFPHQEKTTNKELVEKCIAPVLEESYSKYKNILPKKPEVGMYKMDRFRRGFLIRLFFPEGKIDTFFDIQPELMQDIVNSWDVCKMQKQAE